MNTEPLGLFITWTVYGTFLQGDRRGWRHRRDGPRDSQPKLERWHRDRLNHDVVLLTKPMQTVADDALVEIAEFRNWELWAKSVRSNHVHFVVTAANCEPELVREQFKAKATRELRIAFPIWKGRPVWAAKGDIEFLDRDNEIQECAVYVNEAQDRKQLDM